MKKNYYKAMAVAIAMGLAATPSISFAAENETVDACLEDSSGEAWDEAEENADEGWEDEDYISSEDGDDEDWDETDDAEWEDDGSEDWDETDDAEWEDDGSEDWEYGDDAEWEGDGSEDWEDDDDAEWEGDGSEDWEDDDDVDWEDSDGSEYGEDWDEADDAEWEGDGSEDWEDDPAFEDPSDAEKNPGHCVCEPGIDECEADYVTDDAEMMEELVPDDAIPYMAEKEDADQDGNQENVSISKNIQVSRQAEYADAMDHSLAGVYQPDVKATLYSGAGEKKAVLAVAGKGSKVYCYGYYTEKSGEKWLCVQFSQDGKVYTGFCKDGQLKKA